MNLFILMVINHIINVHLATILHRGTDWCLYATKAVIAGNRFVKKPKFIKLILTNYTILPFFC